MEQKGNKTKWIIVSLLLVTCLAVGITIWALFFRQDEVVLTPDHAPKEEEMVEKIPNDSGEKMESPEGGGSVSLTYSENVTISLKDEKAQLLFANPGKSNQDMVIQILIEDTVVVQSGTLKPGNQVTALNLLDGVSKKLSIGGYEGKFNILYYDQSSGERAIVNTEIPINIEIKD